MGFPMTFAELGLTAPLLQTLAERGARVVRQRQVQRRLRPHVRGRLRAVEPRADGDVPGRRLVGVAGGLPGER